MRTGWILAVLAAAATSAAAIAQVAPPPAPSRAARAHVLPAGHRPRHRRVRGNQPAVKPFVATGLILGRVVDAGTGRPVSGAVVLLSGGPARVQGPPVPGQPAPPPRFTAPTAG
jgi:hypothetical protein